MMPDLPPWSDEDAEAFAREVEAGRDLGELRPQPQRRPVPEVVPLPGPRLLPLVRIGDIPEPGPTQWLVNEIWGERAFGIVGAEPKSWKSWLTLHMGLSVATGMPFLGRYEARRGLVMMFCAEGGKDLVRRRAGAIARALEIDLRGVDLVVLDLPTLHLDVPHQLASLRMTVEAERPALLILDPFREMHTGDENDAAIIAALLAPLRELQHSVGCAVQLVHHMGKAPSDGKARRGGQRLRGSSALHGAVDSALYLEPRGQGAAKRVTVSVEHRAAIELDPFEVRLRDQDMDYGRATWLEIDTAGPEEAEERQVEEVAASYDKQRKAIVKAVRWASMPGRDPLRSANAVCAAVKGTKTTLLKIVRQMLEDGELIKDARGLRVAEEDVL